MQQNLTITKLLKSNPKSPSNFPTSESENLSSPTSPKVQEYKSNTTKTNLPHCPFPITENIDLTDITPKADHKDHTPKSITKGAEKVRSAAV